MDTPEPTRAMTEPATTHAHHLRYSGRLTCMPGTGGGHCRMTPRTRRLLWLAYAQRGSGRPRAKSREWRWCVGLFRLTLHLHPMDCTATPTPWSPLRIGSTGALPLYVRSQGYHLEGGSRTSRVLAEVRRHRAARRDHERSEPPAQGAPAVVTSRPQRAIAHHEGKEGKKWTLPQ